jgi:hypothetical protein
MASVHADSSLIDFVDLPTHAVWAETFPETSRLEQLQDDLFAGRSVTGVLFAVVSVGMLLMAVTVWLCL